MTTSIVDGRDGGSSAAFRDVVAGSAGIDLYRDREGEGVDLSNEFERTISDIAMGEAPSTVTHVLLVERRRGLSKAAIASRIGKTSFDIEGILALLEQRGWVVRFTENGHEKYIVRGARRK
jgi:hypothetical protein